LVFINPFSGTKKAKHILRKVYPLFQVAGAKLTIVETSYAGHCEKYVQKMPLNRIHRIVCVSGDGLLNECVNGLMKRLDWTNALKIPIGIIPAGSGNALATSIGATDPISATMIILKGHTRPLDLNVLYQKDTATGMWKVSRFSFMGLLWTIQSDVDIESEKYRFLGALRFTIGALVRIISLRKYSGNIYFLPAPKFKKRASMKPCTILNECELCDKHKEKDIVNPFKIEKDTGEIAMEGFDENQKLKKNQQSKRNKKKEVSQHTTETKLQHETDPQQLKASRTEKHKNRAKEKVVDEIQENTQPQPSDGKVTEQKKKSPKVN